MMNNPSERLKHARAKRGFSTATEAANAFGWNKNTYRSHENGHRNFTKDDAQKYGRRLQVSVSWLLLGNREFSEHSSMHPEVGLRRVPVLSFADAGRMTETSDPHEVQVGDELVSLDESTDVGERAFAVYVKGDSMSSTIAMSFDDGDIIIIDPDAVIIPGCFVVAKVNGGDEATFNKFRLVSPAQTNPRVIDLVPLNPDYPTIHINAANPGIIIGRAIRLIKKL